jgi:hypothetical protein
MRRVAFALTFIATVASAAVGAGAQDGPTSPPPATPSPSPEATPATPPAATTTPPTPATSAAEQESSFTALIAKGFEIKSVVLVPLEVAKRVTESVKTDNVIVTLQRQESVAVCYVAFANWAFMNKTSLDSGTLCEVR